MFIETHDMNLYKNETENGAENEASITLHFIKSSNVQAYPCGRRRGKITSTEGNVTGYIPFDPEARLNTEYNNTKYSSSNGFTQTYMKPWEENDTTFSLALAGYNFIINLTDSGSSSTISSPNDFGKRLLGEHSTEKHIYANILLEEAPLFKNSELSYNTWILRNMSSDGNGTASDTLDLLVDGGNKENADSYYFAGLSFSTVPFTEIEDTRSEVFYTAVGANNKRIVSLCILDNVSVGGESLWSIHQPALLPIIEHGSTEGSAKIAGNFEANSINTNVFTATSIKQNGITVPSLSLEQVEDSWRLCFSAIDIK